MQYIGTYKVVKIFKKSNRREIIRRNLTIDEAKRIVNIYPDSNTSMVVFLNNLTPWNIMNNDNNQPLALFLAFCVIGAMYGIITLIGMIINI